MAFVPIDPADCAPGRFGKTSLFNLIRTDLDDLNARISSGGPTALFDHFNWRADNDPTHLNKSFQDLGARDNGVDAGPGGFQFDTDDHIYHGRDWDFFSKRGNSGDNRDANDTKPDFSVARMKLRNTVNDCLEGVLLSKLKFQESEIVDPITVDFVLKISQDMNLKMGLAPLEVDDGGYEVDVNDGRNGIYLMRSDSTHWKFRAQSATGMSTDTAAFTAIFGAWFTLHIDFFSDHADCFVNGVNRGPLSTTLPTTTILGAYVGASAIDGISFTTVDIDQAELFVGGLLPAP